jgi:2-C-methyl-D-erythritol 2,4-cyclodiphosphate synthase
MYRIGQGTDFHRLEEGYEFWIGGVRIPHTKGAVAHSDGDVLLHALCDALLGALGLGDIGKHFPDTDIRWKGVDSKVLLQRVYSMVREKGYWLVNADCTLLLEAPKVSPHIEAMQNAICHILNVGREEISIKATTAETLSFIGRQEGVVATATVLLQKF